MGKVLEFKESANDLIRLNNIVSDVMKDGEDILKEVLK